MGGHTEREADRVTGPLETRLRDQLAELFELAGPSAPTLNEGWDAAQLAAHLVLRDRRPDAAAGVLVPVLSAHTARVQRAYAARPWPHLMQLVRSGPPRWSPLALSQRLGETANVIELFVHTEDLRRASPELPARLPDAELDAYLRRRLPGVARFMLRRSPVHVVMRTPGGDEWQVRDGRTPTVTVTGEVPELLLHVFGRDSAADVLITGDDAACTRYAEVSRSI